MAIIPGLKRILLGAATKMPRVSTPIANFPALDRPSPVPVPRMPQERAPVKLVGGIPAIQAPSKNKRIPTERKPRTK